MKTSLFIKVSCFACCGLAAFPTPHHSVNNKLYSLVPSCNEMAKNFIRLAFNDFATKDKDLGTGGIDGSIKFELDRPENYGLKEAYRALKHLVKGKKFSLADRIVMAFIASVDTCSNGKIRLKFRPGRVDATEANMAGLVPGHKDSFEKLQNDFHRMGLGIQAGHSLIAGIHSICNYKRLPLDSTPDVIDNVFLKEIVCEYPQPGTNRMRSDLHLFLASEVVDATVNMGNNEELFYSNVEYSFQRMIRF